jgi:hypothetical protein
MSIVLEFKQYEYTEMFTTQQIAIQIHPGREGMNIASQWFDGVERVGMR